MRLPRAMCAAFLPYALPPALPAYLFFLPRYILFCFGRMPLPKTRPCRVAWHPAGTPVSQRDLPTCSIPAVVAARPPIPNAAALTHHALAFTRHTLPLPGRHAVTWWVAWRVLTAPVYFTAPVRLLAPFAVRMPILVVKGAPACYCRDNLPAMGSVPYGCGLAALFRLLRAVVVPTPGTYAQNFIPRASYSTTGPSPAAPTNNSCILF